MKLEDTLGGGFNGLYGEVVTEDCYKLKEVNFIPDLIVDCGANVGVFSRYARTLFPLADIVAIEPHPENIAVFKEFTHDDNLVLIEKAIGNGKVWHGTTAANGSGEVYMSAGLGYPENKITDAAIVGSAFEECNIETITLSEILNKYLVKGDKVIVKVDIEGNEHVLFSDKLSMDALKKADYVCMEIHLYAIDTIEYKEMKFKTYEALESLRETHYIELDGVHFYGIKK